MREKVEDKGREREATILSRKGGREVGRGSWWWCVYVCVCVCVSSSVFFRANFGLLPFVEKNYKDLSTEKYEGPFLQQAPARAFPLSLSFSLSPLSLSSSLSLSLSLSLSPARPLALHSTPCESYEGFRHSRYRYSIITSPTTRPLANFCYLQAPAGPFPCLSRTLEGAAVGWGGVV